MARRNKTKNGAASRRSLPARGAKISAIASLARLNKAENAPIPGDDEDDGSVEATDDRLDEPPKPVVTQYIPLVPEKPIEVLATFDTPVNLDSGVCVIRKVADGQYQIINLFTVGDGAMGSQDTGALLMKDQELLKLLNIKDKQWDDARIKCSQAVLSARGEIFYFFMLPLEIRNMIYKICFQSKYKLTAGVYDKPKSNINHAFLRTSRTVYEEGAKYFQANTFLIECSVPKLKVMAQFNAENIHMMHVMVNGGYIKDEDTFTFLAKCTSLKKLKVIYTTCSQVTRRARAQYQHQGKSELGPFRHTNGFDILCSLRGLEKVIVHLEPASTHYRFGDDSREKFEEFLMEETTKPPETQAQRLAREKYEADKRRLAAKAAKARKNKARRGRKASMVDQDDSEDEYDGTFRSWAH